jgi:hypothetical protein
MKQTWWRNDFGLLLKKWHNEEIEEPELVIFIKEVIEKEKNDECLELLTKLLSKKEKKPKAKKEDCPMTLDQFIEWCNKSPQRRIKLIGEWADTVKPDKTTKNQWQAYLVANTGYATKLAVFTDEQIVNAFSMIKKDLENGCDYQPSMATLLKKLTK